MIQPFQDLGGRVDCRPVGHGRPINHEDRDTKVAGCVQLGAGAIATGVFGDDDFNIFYYHKVAVGRESEGPSADNSCDIQKGQFAGLVDEAQKVVMLRFCGEWFKVLPTDREENAGWGVGQGGDSSLDGGDVAPNVAFDRGPWQAVQGNQGGFGGVAGGDGVKAHHGGEGVGGVDDMGDLVGFQVVDQAVNTAETADALRQWLRGGGIGAAGVGIGGVDFGVGQGFGEQVRLGCAAKQQDAHHG